MTRQTQLRLALGSLSLLLLCVHPCMATQCASLGLACSASPPPPPPPPGDCLADGAAWTYDATTECCSGYAFGAYCRCLPAAAPVQNTAVECCSRTSDGGSPDLCTAPCVQKSGECEQCISRRRSLQDAGYQQCDCCDGLLCGDNSTYTGSVCTGPPSDPGFGEITATETQFNKYTIEIPLTASNDTGAVGVDVEYYVIGTGGALGSSFYYNGSPSPLKFEVTNKPCGTAFSIEVFASNTAGLVSSTITYPTAFSTPDCSIR